MMQGISTFLLDCHLSPKIETEFNDIANYLPKLTYDQLITKILAARKDPEMSENEVATGILKRIDTAKNNKHIDFRMITANYNQILQGANLLSHIFSDQKKDFPNESDSDVHLLIEVVFENVTPLIDIPNIVISRNTKNLFQKISTTKFWKRHLWATISKNVEALNFYLNLIGKSQDKIVSVDSTIRIQNKLKFLKRFIDSSQIKKDYRKYSEILCHLRGVADYADKLNYQCSSITITAPTEFHIDGNNSLANWNPKLTPDVTNKKIATLWKKFITRLCDDKIDRFIYRAVEPHQDGTPHWHILIWYDKKNEQLIKKRLSSAFTEFTDSHQKNVVWNNLDDNERISKLIYYCIKTLKSKPDTNIENQDNRNYCNVWGIRSAQLTGYPPKTKKLWRMCRRKDLIGDIDHQEVLLLRKSAKSNNFSDFLEVVYRFNKIENTSISFQEKKYSGLKIDGAIRIYY